MLKSMQTRGHKMSRLVVPLLLALIGGLLVAGLAWVSSNIAYLVVVFPLGVGIVGAGIVWWIVDRHKVRNLVAASILAAALTAAAYAGIQYTRYQVFTSEMFDLVLYHEYGENFKTTDIPEIEDRVQGLIVQLTGASGFWGYLELEAMDGLFVAQLFSPTNWFALDLGEAANVVVVWSYRLLEILLIAGIVFASAAMAAVRPFCPDCEEWIGHSAHVCPMRARDLREFIASAPAEETMQAGLLERIGAALVDGVILVLGSLLIGQLVWLVIWVGAMFFSSDRNMSPSIATNYTLLAGIPFTWLYFAFFESSHTQATPGKIALHLTVTDIAGDSISFWRATIRFWLKVGSLAMLGIGLIVAGFTPRKQAMHDILAKTVVLKTGG
jgi:uncharacterized RDD family membrane protein YckC